MTQHSNDKLQSVNRQIRAPTTMTTKPLLYAEKDKER